MSPVIGQALTNGQVAVMYIIMAIVAVEAYLWFRHFRANRNPVVPAPVQSVRTFSRQRSLTLVGRLAKGRN